MNWPGQIFRQVKMLFRRKRFDRELCEEMRLHRDLREREFRQSNQRQVGNETDQVQHDAQRRFGNELHLRERSLDMWGWNWLQDFIQDLRFGARVLRMNPGFTMVAVLSLALGIGANTTIFSIINALTLRSLPVRNPEELVLFDTLNSAHDILFSYAAFTEFRNHASSFSGVLAVCHVDRYNVAINPPEGGAPEWESGVLSVSLTSSNYFSLLGVRPALGRMFADDEDRAPGNNPVVIISYDYWKRRFARSTGVLGRILSLDSAKFTIIGVAPKGFIGEWVGRPSDLWFPLSMVAEVAGWPRALERPNSTWLRIFGRLDPGMNKQRADAATDALWRQIQEENIGTNPSPQALRRMAEERLVLSPVGTGFSPQRESLGRPLLILMGVTGLVLLMACANTANLLLARSSARSKEIGLRLAIGAGRGRIVRQLLTESMLLAVLGGGVGLVFASWGTSPVKLMILL